MNRFFRGGVAKIDTDYSLSKITFEGTAKIEMYIYTLEKKKYYGHLASD